MPRILGKDYKPADCDSRMEVESRVNEVESGKIPPKTLVMAIRARIPPKTLGENIRKVRLENKNRRMDEELECIYLHHKLEMEDREERARLILAGVGVAYLTALHYAWACGYVHKTIEVVNNLAYNFLSQFGYS